MGGGGDDSYPGFLTREHGSFHSTVPSNNTVVCREGSPAHGPLHTALFTQPCSTSLSMGRPHPAAPAAPRS